MPKLQGKDTSAYADLDLDELLSQLNEEQLEELSLDLIDPDVSGLFHTRHFPQSWSDP